MAPTLKDLILTPGNRCYFRRLVNYQLIYAVQMADGTEFEFPVDLSDADGATFLAEDTPSLFKRWIRRELEASQKRAELPRVAFVRYEHDGRKVIFKRLSDSLEFVVPLFSDNEYLALDWADKYGAYIRDAEEQKASYSHTVSVLSAVIGKKWARVLANMDLYGPVIGYSEVDNVLRYDVRHGAELGGTEKIGSYLPEELMLLDPPTCSNTMGFILCGEGGQFCSDECQNRGK